MIPMRYRIRFETMVSNTLGYICQLFGYISFGIVSGILYLFLVASERSYSFFYSRYNAYRNRAEYCRDNTYYLRDGYGRRIKIYRRPEFFDPLFCRPPLPPRRQG